MERWHCAIAELDPVFFQLQPEAARVPGDDCLIKGFGDVSVTVVGYGRACHDGLVNRRGNREVQIGQVHGNRVGREPEFLREHLIRPLPRIAGFAIKKAIKLAHVQAPPVDSSAEMFGLTHARRFR